MLVDSIVHSSSLRLYETHPHILYSNDILDCQDLLSSYRFERTSLRVDQIDHNMRIWLLMLMNLLILTNLYAIKTWQRLMTSLTY